MPFRRRTTSTRRRAPVRRSRITPRRRTTTRRRTTFRRRAKKSSIPRLIGSTRMHHYIDRTQAVLLNFLTITAGTGAWNPGTALTAVQTVIQTNNDQFFCWKPQLSYSALFLSLGPFYQYFKPGKCTMTWRPDASVYQSAAPVTGNVAGFTRYLASNYKIPLAQLPYLATANSFPTVISPMQSYGTFIDDADTKKHAIVSANIFKTHKFFQNPLIAQPLIADLQNYVSGGNEPTTLYNWKLAGKMPMQASGEYTYPGVIVCVPAGSAGFPSGNIQWSVECTFEFEMLEPYV